MHNTNYDRALVFLCWGVCAVASLILWMPSSLRRVKARALRSRRYGIASSRRIYYVM